MAQKTTEMPLNESIFVSTTRNWGSRHRKVSHTGILSSRKAIYGQLNHRANGASMRIIVDC